MRPVERGRARRLPVPPRLRPLHPGRQLADRQCRHRLRARRRPLPDPGRARRCMAPSGVLMVGLALVLRDMVQRRLGLGWASAAVLAGAALSALLAPPALVVASAAAFLLSEAVDLAVYTPLQRRGLVLAVALSSVAGLVLDSVVVPAARLRQPRLPRRAGGREAVDGARIPAAGGVAAAPRREARASRRLRGGRKRATAAPRRAAHGPDRRRLPRRLRRRHARLRPAHLWRWPRPRGRLIRVSPPPRCSDGTAPRAGSAAKRGHRPRRSGSSPRSPRGCG